MEIKISTAEMVMVDAFRTMRQIAKSKGTHENKEKAMNDVFWRANKILDINEGRK